MATSNSFDIQDLFQKVFGITGVRFAIPAASQVINGIARTAAATAEFAAGQAVNQAFNSTAHVPAGYSDIQTISVPAAKAYSALGTPIYEQIQLSAPAGVINGKNVPVLNYTFPGWPLFDITGQNIIISTPITGQKGKVKEYIAEDDYSITIRGFLISDDSEEYPEQQLKELMQVIDRKVSFQITSAVFNECFDIHGLIINSWHFPEVEGYPNIQPFELDCTSDTPVVLTIQSVKPITPGL